MQDSLSTPNPASRRRFLAGLAGVAGTGILAACSSDDGDDAAGPDAAGPDAAGPDASGPDAANAGAIVGTASVARFFGPYYLAGSPARVPFGLADDDGLIRAELLPDRVSVQVLDPSGAELAADVDAELYTEGLPRPYYAMTFVPASVGFHDLVLATPFGEVRTQMQVVDADDPVASAIVGPGDAMPLVDTPTVDDARGVDPICTRTPHCDLHAMTVADVVASPRASVVMVSTPAFCQTAICGPVLDLLLDQVSDHPDVDFVHVEVFKDPANNSTPLGMDDFAPVVAALGLPFEPVLYTIDPDGVVGERLDYIFGSEEISGAIGRLVV